MVPFQSSEINDFFRFPHTPHLLWLGEGSPRDDKVLPPEEAKELLEGEVTVEEKLDGANLGLSVGPDGKLRAQNRGQYLDEPYHGQFSRLGAWLAARRDTLEAALFPNLILFGEWCAARHTVGYERLPDLFLGFDVYDRDAGNFWSTTRRNRLFSEIGIVSVPERRRGKVGAEELKAILDRESSLYTSGPMEGLVIRKENADRLISRAKLVRAGFTQAITGHWKKRGIEWNRVEITPVPGASSRVSRHAPPGPAREAT